MAHAGAAAAFATRRSMMGYVHGLLERDNTEGRRQFRGRRSTIEGVCARSVILRADHARRR